MLMEKDNILLQILSVFVDIRSISYKRIFLISVLDTHLLRIRGVAKLKGIL